jgi:hypothetical protein
MIQKVERRQAAMPLTTPRALSIISTLTLREGDGR